jgi:hypothetical protein
VKLYDVGIVALLAVLLVCAVVRPARSLGPFAPGRWRIAFHTLLGGAVSAAAIHVCAGYKHWQMMPAYGVLVASLFLSVSLRRRPVRVWLASRRHVRIMLAVCGAGVLGLTPLAWWLFPALD